LCLDLINSMGLQIREGWEFENEISLK